VAAAGTRRRSENIHWSKVQVFEWEILFAPSRECCPDRRYSYRVFRAWTAMGQDVNDTQRRVLILAPARNDAAALASVIQRSGIATAICGDMNRLCREMAAGMGVAVIAEEALLAARDSDRLQERLKAEPQW